MQKQTGHKGKGKD
jgi:hypothetical protein